MGKRFVARLLDGLILGIPLSIVYFGLTAGAISQVEGDRVTGETTSGGGFLAALLAFYGLTFVATIAYEVVLIALRGATLGKQIMKIKVVQEANGSLPGWSPSVIRWIIPTAGSFVCGIGQLVVFLSPLFDNSGRQQGWHDKAAKTHVVNA
ncbi:MAG: RDD family protein [Angustibacter sp.]